MPRPALPVLASLLLFPGLAGPATAQGESLSLSQRLAVYRACKPDLDRNCPDAGTNAGRIRACLITHQRSLSGTCRSTILSTGAR